MSTETHLADELARRLERRDPSGTIEAHPGPAGEVLDLERLATQLERAAGARPSAAFARQARQRLVRAIEARPPARLARAPSRFGPSLVWASALAAAILVCLAGAGGASFAAAASLPGDLLFPAKTAFEQAALDLAPDPAARAALSLEITERRLNEGGTLLDRGQAAHAAAALEAAAASLGRTADLLEAVDQPGARDELTGELALLLPRVEKTLVAAQGVDAPEMGHAIAALTRAGRHAVEVGERVGPQHKYEFHEGMGNGGPGVDKWKHNTAADGEGKSSKSKGRGPQRTRTPKKPTGPPAK